MYSRFSATTPVLIDVPTTSVPIQEYLAEPERFVQVLVDSRRMQVLGNDEYRLTLAPLSFFMLHLQPIVDLQVHTERNSTVHLASTGYEVRGVDYKKYGFSLDLTGQLCPITRKGRTVLVGRAILNVGVKLPPALQFTPKALVEASGNALLSGILSTIEHRLRQNLIPDYQRWAQEVGRKAA